MSFAKNFLRFIKDMKREIFGLEIVDVFFYI